ncbi:MAG: heavy metal translocating P-type ATPase [Prevotella sp.]|uniref:heavy metal translocating P-type ATPase n=1 Tax=Prevotella sp. AGR2160 TaxID=1280674 RepID=UPI0003FDF5EC|nr:heavy metal translocating P-type ATPase [Prevotella sp. AGR2160]MDD5862309.1 heavy metal translocating P-type ATPase [Prevotella sp.]
MNKKLLRILLTAVLLLIAWLEEHFAGLPTWQLLLVYLIPYIYISYDVLGEAWEGIKEGDPFDEDFLMAIATIGALLIGFLPGAENQMLEAVFVMLFFQVGELFEDYAEDKSRKSISAMMDLRPDTAFLEKKGKVTEVSPETVKIGDIVVVKPGGKIPMDGEIVEGESSLNTVALTGESMPRQCTVGDNVYSGCVNLSGVLRIRVTKSFGESTASKIIQLVESSSQNKSKSETFIHRFAKVYTPIVVFLAVALAFIPPFFYSSYVDGFSIWLYRALSFLVVSCPCALVISVPLAFFGGIGGASRKGILIKGGNYMDVLDKTGIVVFDKTGTLTKGVFAVEAVHPEQLDQHELLHLAAHVEQFSTHPIAMALRQAYGKPCTKCQVEHTEEIAGKGIVAEVNGKKVYVGNEKLMDSIGAQWHPCHLQGTTIHVAIDGVYAGHVVINDQIKEDSKEAISRLKALGVKKTVMLTGDKKAVADHVAGELGLDAWHAELLPADKVSYVEKYIKEKPEGERLAFVGDGINDAPVLARADVGIAMGAMGSDAAIEAADVVLMDDKPSKIATAIRIARHTLAIARENVTFAIAVKILILVLVALGVLGRFAMPLAVFGDVGVMVLCVLNAARALNSKE